MLKATRYLGWCLRSGGILSLTLWLTASTCFAQTSTDEGSSLPRHPLETAALINPDQVLQQLPAEIEGARQSGDLHLLSLLELARANACRVVADWSCQRDAGEQAAKAARAAREPILEVRGLIAQSRGSFARQDYTRGEHLLGDAQILLERNPSPELSADVYLAYSSLSFMLGKHESAAHYADLGLEQLGPTVAPAMRARLLRNRARAESQLHKLESARKSLSEALAAADAMKDPKLAAELALESARVARLDGDVRTQRAGGERVLALGAQLENTQLAGLGHEVLGLAALDDGDRATAETELRTAYRSFRELGLPRDELRLARQLMQLMVDHDTDSSDWNALVARFLTLDREVIQSDRAKAADDYEARLTYAAQEMDVLRLANEAELAREREKSLAEANRLSAWLMAATLAIIAVLSFFFLLQRRSNHRLEAALAARRESEAKATDLLRLSKGMVFLHDLRGELVMVNLATAEALGTLPEQLVGRALGEFLTDDSRREFESYLARLSQQQQDEGTMRMRRSDSAERLWQYSTRLSESRGYAIGHAVDITEQAREAAALRAENLRDALTLAYNRRYISVFEREQGAGTWAVVNIDLDQFKQINDSLGHDAGDQVLVQMTRYLQQQIPSGAAVVRSGGDEFVLLLPDATREQIRSLIARLRQDMPAAPCRYSIGHGFREHGERLGDTLARADAEMYELRRESRRDDG
jgi:diguanylate cyclase (GGDEF)-like protein/PAS domain S-box-containing protein